MQLPGPLRAAVGLVVSAAEEARHLPDRAIELPMLAVSTALQASLRAQQRYAGLAAKGDAVLNRRTPTEAPPPWASFDEPVPVEQFVAEPLARPTPTPTPSTPADADPEVTVAKKPSPAKKAAKKTSTAKSGGEKKASTRKPAVKRTGPSGGDAGSGGKRVSKPRHTPPSAFDNVD